MTVDLTTRYLGLELRSPIVASAGPRNGDPVMATRLERAGVGAIVLPSLFEEEILAEEIELNRSLEQGTEHFAEALDYFPAVDTFVGRRRPLPGRARAGQGPAAVPIIASLNARSMGGWVTHYARRIQDAGRGRARAEPVPRRRGSAAGRPPRWRRDDLDLDRRRARRDHDPAGGQAQPVLLGVRQLRGGDRPRRRRWARAVQSLLPAGPRPRDARGRPAARAEPAVGAAAPGALDRHPATPARPGPLARRDLGRPSGADVVKGLLVGADVVMMTSALLRHGPEHVATVETELRDVDGRARVHIGRPSSAAARARRRSRTRPRSSVPTTWRRSVPGRPPRAERPRG